MDQLSSQLGQQLENNYVKSTYDNIAEDFSRTRHSKWPKVESFLKEIPIGSLLLDVGCGNGKYLDNPTTFNIGCDLSLNLLSICRSRNFEVVLCDMSRLPFKEEVFDSVICVASLHHVVSEQRRQKCLESILLLLNPSIGRLLVQVWSFEQEFESNNPYIKRRLTDDQIYEVQSGNLIAITETVKLPVHKNRTPFASQDVLVPFHTKSTTEVDNLSASKSESTEFRQRLRYYHVFKQKELDAMFDKIRDARIEQSYYDKGNWCVIASRYRAQSKAS